VIGRYDPFVPAGRKNGLLQAIDMHAPGAYVVKIRAGHFKTLIMSGGHQRALPGVKSAPSSWRWPRNLPAWPAASKAQVATGLE
jgi:hypothetical protein